MWCVIASWLAFGVFECILELRIVPFRFLVTVTLTSDLVSRICIKSGAKLLYSLR